jgi:hypothetical protein
LVLTNVCNANEVDFYTYRVCNPNVSLQRTRIVHVEVEVESLRSDCCGVPIMGRLVLTEEFVI